jgi:hypothetical protein
MSADFTKILVKDDRLNVVDNIKYAVVKGGQNVTMAQFRAISATDSQIVFNIQVPSEQTIIDRRVLLTTDLTITVTSKAYQWSGATPPVVGVFEPTEAIGCGYGSYAGLAPYPLHQLMTVASATINNNTVSINIRDVLPAIIRLLDKEHLGAYNGMSATATDSMLQYSSSIYSASNPLAGVQSQTLDTDLVGRSSIYLKYRNASYDGTSHVCTEVFTFHISEPLLLSPFIYSDPQSNSQGFYGIQNMNIVLNMGSTDRMFRALDGVDGISKSGAYDATAVYASPAGVIAVGTASSALPVVTGVSLGGTIAGKSVSGFSENTSLLFTFLTPHPSDLMPARNIVPYYELPRYITKAQAQSEPMDFTGEYVTPIINLQGGALYTTQTLQLNQIPDKLIIFISKQGQSYGDTDAYLPIRHISVNFNNNSGILSAARCEDLYRMAKDNGSNQSWNEWTGVATGSTSDVVTLPGGNVGVAGISTLQLCPLQDVPYQTGAPVPTVGSVCVLEFGKDIQLVEDFFSCGSLGNFNLQLNIYADNNNPSIPLDAPLNIYIVTMNSGVFVCERGTSSTYTGILTRADVLEASEQDAYTHSDVKRMVGGGFLDRLKSGVAKLAPLVKAVAPALAPMAKEYLSKKGSLGKLASSGISALGYGMAGSGPTGGGPSGGALKGRYM